MDRQEANLRREKRKGCKQERSYCRWYRRNVYQGTCCNQKRPRPSQETRKEDHQEEMDRQEANLRREKRKSCKEQRSFPFSTGRYERIIHFYITSEKCKIYNEEIKYNDEILKKKVAKSKEAF